MQLSIVIPAYNEQARIVDSVSRVLSYVRDWHDAEVIVVDDGSTDKTPELLEELGKNQGKLRVLRLEKNSGKGAAVRLGIRNARGSYVLVSDADLSTPIEEANKLLEISKRGYPIVIGSRALTHSDIQVRQPWYRERMGRIFNLLVQTFLLKGIHDTQCGFKLYSLPVAQTLFSAQTEDGYTYDVEVLLLARQLGYAVFECPVIWRHAEFSRVSPILDSTKMFMALGRLWWKCRKHKQ
ncbi:MAG: glycosyltransferase family 2 protein [Myxococcales bacterium]|nr:glycosyltransferase family 2 protein [Myxococcales bacterium]